MNVEPSRRAYFTQFESVPSTKNFAQVSYDGTQLCGVTTNSETVCATVTKGRALEWRSLQKPMKWISVANGRIWGATATGNVFWTESGPSSSGWSPVQATYAKLSTDGRMLCGMQANEFTLRCGSKDITTKPVTFYDTVPLRDIGVVDGIIYGLNAKGATYGYGPQAFPESPGPFQSVTSDGQILCAVADSGDSLSCVSRTTVAGSRSPSTRSRSRCTVTASSVSPRMVRSGQPSCSCGQRASQRSRSSCSISAASQAPRRRLCRRRPRPHRRRMD
ncbi:hypothetical protein PINS_up006869 [Pythium insidiosum]|nr:hypothetical protein PINS_up006869 [Pythium insidiosum]